MNITQQSLQALGRVAVICGGDGSERAVSLDSGQAVYEALQRLGVSAELIDGVPALIVAVHERRVDRVFNILHGGAGENGVLQGLLQAQGVPCTGSGVLGAALSMDKIRSKQVWQSLELPTTIFHAHKVGAPIASATILDRLGLPLIVKPAREGSTVGVERVYQADQLVPAIERAGLHDSLLLLEPLIDGEDVTVAIVNGRALPAVRIRPASGFYDYHAKYQAEDTEYLCPGVDAAVENELAALALQAFTALDCSGWGRVDLMQQRDGRFQLLEVNTTPGMTSHSLVPMAARQAGMSFEELVWQILHSH
ncbi:MAG: D-alanine--D-alanine ligase [Wenzhouxiangellaceae bacterium]